jgi:beta-glucanase (GH16 family)
MNRKLVFSTAVLLVLVAIVIVLFTNCASNPNQNSNKNSEEYFLIWQNEFEYNGLPDSTKWNYDTEGNEFGWGNNEAQYYTESRIENAVVNDGIMKIRALKEDFSGKDYTSARLISKFEPKYGKIEVSAKLPDGRGTWAAIWMMPGGWSFNDGNWPDIGEIDIMEHVGHDPGVIHASAHSKDYQWQKGTQKTAVINVPKATEEFHTYILEWSPYVLKAFVDDSLYFEYWNEGLGETKWPYDKPFYLILNVAVGGEWGNIKGIDDEAFPQVMEIDYVRVYQKDGTEK